MTISGEEGGEAFSFDPEGRKGVCMGSRLCSSDRFFTSRPLLLVVLLLSWSQIPGQAFTTVDFSGPWRKQRRCFIRSGSAIFGWSGNNPDPSSDASYWESLYTKSAGDVPLNPLMEGAPSGRLAASNEEEPVGVEVVSFDLDDTLWPGKTIIDDANRALDDYLKERYPRMVGEGKPSVGAVMGAVANKYPDDFLEVKADPSSVVRFTDLRKLALAAMAKDAGYDDPDDKAEECFAVWIAARHQVERLLFPGVLQVLRRLKDRGVRLCAITNGNCDVMLVPSLAPLLDFCINAERVGARKRTGRPYEAAFSEAGVPSADRRWVHIGDDFSEDMAAAKAFNVRTIWFRTKEMKAAAEAKERMKAQRKPLDAMDGGRPGIVSGVQERYFQDKDVIRVSGTQTDDYLAHFIVKEFVDAEAETMNEVVSVIEGWIDEASKSSPSSVKGDAGPQPPRTPPEQEQVPVRGAVAEGTEAPHTRSSHAERTHKFCISCGEKLVAKARYCSACGEQQ